MIGKMQSTTYLYQFIFGIREDAKVFIQFFDTVSTHDEAYARSSMAEDTRYMQETQLKVENFSRTPNAERHANMAAQWCQPASVWKKMF